MKMRPPSVPLITVDPYFSVWSAADRLYDKHTEHWTASPNSIEAVIIVDGEEKRFMGEGSEAVIPQSAFDMDAFISEYQFSDEKVCLKVSFFTPLFPDDLYRLSRPVSYMDISYCSLDGKEHDVKIRVSASEELCINKKNEKALETEVFSSDDMTFGKIGSVEQNILSKSGDDLRIDWGYFYLSSSSDSVIEAINKDNMIWLRCSLALKENEKSTILFAYDDIYSINYFGEKVEAYWKKAGKSISCVIKEAYEERSEIYELCKKKAADLNKEAVKYGGEEYSELLSLAYRQLIAAHKLAVDGEGNNIFISKECFSNGCAATVDVTYPSSPFFILYNTELLKAMLRPIFKFTADDEWKFDFAPHDVGQYPLILGQVYGKNHEAEGKYLDYQMPVEECGNMLIMTANIAIRDGNTEFFDMYEDIIAQWVKYLIKYGMDPENQLCTDDFAGHLAHNCNLSLKAIMGIEGYSVMLRMKNSPEAQKYHEIAAEMAENWVKNSSNSDGSFRLTFDRENTFSMKYNMVWDKIWGSGLFAPSVYNSEALSNFRHFNAYGLPLDNRQTYTKSDWLVWTACLCGKDAEFRSFIHPLWNCYNVTPTRVPMTDWYDTVTSKMVGFRHRSVQGGLFIKLLEDKLKI